MWSRGSQIFGQDCSDRDWALENAEQDVEILSGRETDTLEDSHAVKLYDKILLHPRALARWLNTSVLVIEEVSMISGQLFRCLKRIAEILRQKRSKKAWGGL